jgi:hypothetical protein
MECMVMCQRYHRGFTAAEKTELWDRWQRGESLKAIGRAFGKADIAVAIHICSTRSGYDDCACVLSSPGVVKSLEVLGRGPVGLLHTQKVGIKYKKPTWQAAGLEVVRSLVFVDVALVDFV